MSVSQLRLATGKRINSASDDASGYVMSKKMTGRISSLSAALDNIGDAQGTTIVTGAATSASFQVGDTGENFSLSFSKLDTAVAGSQTASEELLGTAAANITNAVVNTEAARSRILDADIAKEQINASKLQILQQTATASLAQANQSGQAFLSLFR